VRRPSSTRNGSKAASVGGLVRDPLAIGLGLADQRRQAPAQLGGGGLVEAVVDIAGIDQVLALAPAEIDAINQCRRGQSWRWSASPAARRSS
jgi:hypothetical protein